MNMTMTEKISVKSFLNAFLKELQDDVQFEQSEHTTHAIFQLHSQQMKLKIPLTYYSLVGRHQYDFTAIDYTPSHLIDLLIKELTHRYPKAPNADEFILRFKNSVENLECIFKYLPNDTLEKLFSEEADFELTENCLLSGHSLHPAPKSRVGFSRADFKKYSPELRQKFQLHYFLANKNIVATDCALPTSASQLVTKYLLHNNIPDDKVALPLHPWQAQYLANHPVMQRYLQSKQLLDLGLQGEYFSATSSVRTVYSDTSPFMLKFSLNVAVTNSVRMQYAKELYRGVAAHRFWEHAYGRAILTKYPQFVPITDPAFICLRNDEKLLDETAVLLRMNPFQKQNVTSLASLCQDHPLQTKNRFNVMIEQLALAKKVTLNEAALLWFATFLRVAIEPLLWIYAEYGIGLEAHQQNLLIELENHLPCKSYYRDNQGYYMNEDAQSHLAEGISSDILQHFCQGTHEFISHHLIYYIVGNSVFGVINALGTTSYVKEEVLMSMLRDFIAELASSWTTRYPFLQKILQLKTLPFKANLLTRFYELDELTAPLDAQSVYIEIENHLHKGKI